MDPSLCMFAVFLAWFLANPEKSIHEVTARSSDTVTDFCMESVKSLHGEI